MNKNYLKYLLFCFSFFMFGLLNVEALTYSVNGDLINMTEKNVALDSSGKPKFKIGGTTKLSSGASPSYSNAGWLKNLGGVTGGTSANAYGYVSMPNGTYYIYSETNFGTYPKQKVTVSNSCTSQTPTNQKGKFTVEKCFVRSSSSSEPMMVGETIATCASGYTLDEDNLALKVNTCPSADLNVNGTKLSYRYCRIVFELSCVKKSGSSSSSTVAAPTIKSLSLSSGKISFKSGTKKYNVTVDSNVSSVKITATAASGSSFVKNYGPRTVKLNYGSNSVKLKVKNTAGKTVTYTLNITRKDDRSTVNTLSNLTVSSGTLSPAFSSSNNNYTVDVNNEVASLTINATLTDNKSSFASGFGPRTVNLEPGPNKVYIKVTNEKGSTNVYNITVNRATTPSICTTQTESLALLKEINLSSGMEDIVIDQIKDFDPLNLTYDDVKVPFGVYNLIVNAYTQDEGDTVNVEGTDNLEENVTREVKITVTSKQCPNYSNTYTLNVTRQSEVVLGSNGELKSMTIEGHDEFKFESNKENYDLIIKSGEERLTINKTPVEANTSCIEEGNDKLEYGDKISVVCTSEDGSDVVTYTITIDGVEKPKNGALVIVLVIVIIIILIYLVLRLLGYRIYFNFAVIGAFFRGIGEKFRNMFDK